MPDVFYRDAPEYKAAAARRRALEISNTGWSWAVFKLLVIAALAIFLVFC